MKKVAILFEIRLSVTNPAPPILEVVKLEGTPGADLKTKAIMAKAELQKKYDKHMVFNRLGAWEDVSDYFTVESNATPIPVPTVGEIQ